MATYIRLLFSPFSRLIWDVLVTSWMVYSVAGDLQRHQNQRPTHLIVAPRIVRPGHLYRVAITLPKILCNEATPSDGTLVHATVSRDGGQVAQGSVVAIPCHTTALLLQIPQTNVDGNFELKLEGTSNLLLSTHFQYQAPLAFTGRYVTIIVHTNRPVYNANQLVKVRVVVLMSDMTPFGGSVNVNFLDPNRYIMAGSPAVQLILGAGSAEYQLPEYPVTGWWRVQVDAYSQVEEKEFLVERFHIPKAVIYVSLPEYLMDDEPELSGTAIAIYMSNTGVIGNASITLWAEPPGHYTNAQYTEKGIISNSNGVNGVVQLRQLLDMAFTGSQEFSFDMSEVQREFKNLVGWSVRVQLDVTDALLGMSFTGHASTLIISSTVSIRFLESSPQVFKPGLPFRTRVVLSHNATAPVSAEKLANAVIVVSTVVTTSRGPTQYMDPITIIPLPEDGVAVIKMDTPVDAVKLLLEARHEDLESGVIATCSMVVRQHWAISNRRIHVRPTSLPVHVDNYAVFHVQSTFNMAYFNYLVVSKGVIISTGEEIIEDVLFQPIVTMTVPVSREMAPGFRLVVYHMTQDGHIVSDGVFVPVEVLNTPKVKVTLNEQKDDSGKTVELGVLDEQGVFYGVAGQDADTYCHKCGGDFTQEMVMRKLWEMEKDTNDYGKSASETLWTYPDLQPDVVTYYETPDHALSDDDTFKLAGLHVFTDGEQLSQPDVCHSLEGFLSCSNGRCYPKDKKCDGEKDCDDGDDEMGCNDRLSERDRLNFRLYRKSRDHQIYDPDEGDWAWISFNTDRRSFFSLPVPNRPSNWFIFAFRIDEHKGISVLPKPIFFKGVKPFFMNVEMPPTCRRGEQVAIRLDLFNNQPMGIFVTLVLFGSDDHRFVLVDNEAVISAYYSKTHSGDHQHLVWIGAATTKTIYFPIVATKVGEVTVILEAWSGIASDSAELTLNVQAPGAMQNLHTSILLDLKNQPQNLQFLEISLTETPIVPYEFWRYYIYESRSAHVSITGDVFGPVIGLPMTESASTSVLKLASQSCEQALFGFGFTLWTMHYLRLTNQLHMISSEHFTNINVYCAYVMHYRNSDGSFSMWKGDEPSVWLTADVLRLLLQSRFADWENNFAVDARLLIETITWLLQYQASDGSFFESSSHIYKPSMQGSHTRNWDKSPQKNKNRLRMMDELADESIEDIPLTAFVLITFNHVENIPDGNLKSSLSLAKQAAARYLERVRDIKRPYEMALVTYALTIFGSPKSDYFFAKLDAMKREQEGTIYWSSIAKPPVEIYMDNQRPFTLPRRPKPEDALSVETTAYALLIYIVKEGLMQIQENIVRWLNTMRKTEGGFVSTQDTIIAMQALAEFSFRARLREVTDMSVTVDLASSPGENYTIAVNEANFAHLQTIEVGNVWGHVAVVAQGSGMAILQLDTNYGVDYASQLIPPATRAFDLFVSASFSGRNSSIINLRACQRWILESEAKTSGVAVFEMDIPSGYFQHQPMLDKYVADNHVPNLRRIYVTPSKIYAYFLYLDAELTCIEAQLQRWWPVANLTQYLKAKIYHLYSPEQYNETIFNFFNLYNLDICAVCGSYQCPYCPHYSRANSVRVTLWAFLLCIFATLWKYSLQFKIGRI